MCVITNRNHEYPLGGNDSFAAYRDLGELVKVCPGRAPIRPDRGLSKLSQDSLTDIIKLRMVMSVIWWSAPELLLETEPQ